MARIQAMAIWAAATLAPAAWAAGQLCTMPNGVIIRMAASSCPRGTVKAEPDDGRTLPAKQTPTARPAPPPRPPPAPVQASRAGAPPPTPAPPTAPKASAYDSAQAICKILQTVASATTCDVQSGFFSASIIDATIATSPRDAQAACQLIATQTRAPGSAFAGAGWELRMFHPMGSSTRPIASCKL